MKTIRLIYRVMMRELLILRRNHIYRLCMVLFPLLVLFFFTSLMEEGLPQSLPVGVVDHDNSSVTRALTRQLDGFQMSRVTAHYSNVTEARHAIQQGDIYGFIYFPKGTTDALLAGRQPKVSYFYTNTSLTAGAMVMKDLKTVSTLGSAAVGMATMQARGLTKEQMQTMLMPIKIDLHQIANPWGSYNIYLTTAMVPGIMMLFIFLITAYSLGTELKFDSSKEWLAMADNRMIVPWPCWVSSCPRPSFGWP